MNEKERIEKAIAAQENLRGIVDDAIINTIITTLRQRLIELESLPDVEQKRKQITILFADISGFTAMSEKLDAEEVTEVLNDLWERLDNIIKIHGGVIDKHIGDAVMALWGTEITREDDTERAIQAALDMQIELSSFRKQSHLELAMRIGLNSGPVLLGEIGTTGEYTAMGDTVNLASRLEQAAPIGGILISYDTYRLVRGVFDVQVLEPILVKGKHEPVQVYVVQQVKPRAFRMGTRGIEGIETRMVGREIELKKLQDAFQSVIKNSKHQVVTILGEAGVGKSRLLFEFDKWAELLPEKIYYFKGRASLEMQHLPYGLIRDLVSFRCQIQDSDPPVTVRQKIETGIGNLMVEKLLEENRQEDDKIQIFSKELGELKAHFIGQMLGFDFRDSPYIGNVLNDPRQILDRSIIYLIEYFEALSTQNPILMMLEDLHWADESSLNVLTRISKAVKDQPLMILCSSRPLLFKHQPQWGEGLPFHTLIEIGPLSVQNSNMLVHEVLQKVDQVPESLRDIIVSGADGNPYYVEELIKMLIEDGVVVKGEDKWWIKPEKLTLTKVPPTLVGILQSRLDRLPTNERIILQQASVVGRKFWDEVVAWLSEENDRGNYQEKIRNLDEKIEAIHPALAILLDKEMIFKREASAFVGTQEYIFKHALLREVTYESVLKRIRRVYHELVAKWLVEHSGERINEITGLIADHLELAGKKEEAAVYLRRAGEQAAALFANVEAIEYFNRALELIPDSDPESQYGLRASREKIYNLQGARQLQAEDLTVLAELAQVLDAHQGTTWRRAEIALRQAMYDSFTGDYTASVNSAKLAVDLAQSRMNETFPEMEDGERSPAGQEAAGLLQWGQALWYLGDYDAALSKLDQARLKTKDMPKYQADIFRSLGAINNAFGEYDKAREYHELAIKMARKISDRRGEAAALNNIGFVASNQGDFAGAIEYYEKSLNIFQSIGDKRGEEHALSGLGYVTHIKGDDVNSRRYYQQSLEICRQIEDRSSEGTTLIGLGFVYSAEGNIGEARENYIRALEIFQEIGDLSGQSRALGALGYVTGAQGNYSESADYYKRALIIFRQLGEQAGESRSLTGLGYVAGDLGDYESAVQYYEEALKIRRQIGDREGEGHTLDNLGDIFRALRKYDKAREYHERALSIRRDINDKPGEGYSLTGLGDAWLGLGSPEKAADIFREAYHLRFEIDQPHLAMESLAGMARCKIALNDLSAALEDVEVIYKYLSSGYGLAGTVEPLQIYFTCFKVLEGNQDSRAKELLSQAYDVLRKRADAIDDEDLRLSFIENVPVHREIALAYQQLNKS